MHPRPSIILILLWSLAALALCLPPSEALGQLKGDALPPGIQTNPAAMPILPAFVGPRRGPPALGYTQTPFLALAEAQPVEWRPWSDASMKEAKRSDKLIVLSIGASWCHWCYEMGQESFKDETLATLLNEKFVPIIVDRDLYPEVDRRYQRVVSTLSGRGGWPLTAVLTPGGDVIWGGGFVSAKDYGGHPGLISILTHLLESYERDPEPLEARARSNTERALALEAQIARPRAAAPSPPKPKDMSISPAPEDLALDPWAKANALDYLLGSLLETWDAKAPGFGQAPRFPQGNAISLLLTYGGALELSEPIDRALRTLDTLADSSLRDPISGLFFRYATDEDFNRPGFEILLTTNAELLGAYLKAYQLTRRRSYADVAEGIISGLIQEMGLEGGGFAASMGGGGAQGHGYFTVDPEALKEVMSPQELEALTLRYGMVGSSPLGDTAPFPLATKRSLPEIARRMNLTLYDAQLALARAEEILRRERRAGALGPLIKDTTLQVAWNAQLATVLFEGERILGNQEAGKAALATVERILGGMDPEFSAVPLVLTPEGSGGADVSASRLMTAQSLLAAHETTGEARYLAQAKRIVDGTLDAFWDEKGGGFFDTLEGQSKSLLMGTQFKDLLDGVQPSTNGVGLSVLQSLSRWTGDPRYAALAQEALSTFEPLAPQLGPLGGAFGQALLETVSPPPLVLIAGEGLSTEVAQAPPSQLGPFHRAARETFRPGTIVLSVDPQDPAIQGAFNLTLPQDILPEKAAPMSLPPPVVSSSPSTTGAVAWLCGDLGCSQPILSSEALRAAIQDYGRFPAPVLLPPPGRPREVP